jgi:inorganic triphosphatase YgiF
VAKSKSPIKQANRPASESEEHELKLVPDARMQAKLLSVRPIQDVEQVLAQVKGLLGVGDLRVTEESVHVITDEYFDTQRLHLFHANRVFRVRREGGQLPILVMKKLLEKDVGLIKRKEYPREISEDEYRGLVKKGFREILTAFVPDLAGQRLNYILNIRNERRNLYITRGKEKYCLSLDTFVFGNGRDGRTSGEQFEIELEAKSQVASARLPTLKGHVKRALPGFDFAPDSKYERAVKYFGLNDTNLQIKVSETTVPSG